MKKFSFKGFSLAWFSQKWGRSILTVSFYHEEEGEEGRSLCWHHSPGQSTPLPIPSAKTNPKIPFLASEFPNWCTKTLQKKLKSERVVLLIVSLISKGLFQLNPSWAKASWQTCVWLTAATRNPSHPQKELIEFITNSLKIWVHFIIFHMMRDPRPKKQPVLRAGAGSALVWEHGLLLWCRARSGLQWGSWDESRHRQKELANLDWKAQLKFGIFPPALPSPVLHSSSGWLHAARQAAQQRRSRNIANPGLFPNRRKTETRGC